jgi:hypothetical protein
VFRSHWERLRSHLERLRSHLERLSPVNSRVTLNSIQLPPNAQFQIIHWLRLVYQFQISRNVLVSALNPGKQKLKLVDFLSAYYTSIEFLPPNTPISSVSRREAELVEVSTEAHSARRYQFSQSKSQLYASSLRRPSAATDFWKLLPTMPLEHFNSGISKCEGG